MFQLRSIIHGETSVPVIGINDDVQFCTALKPKCIKHVLVLNVLKVLLEVVSVNPNSYVTVLYTHVTLRSC